MSGAVPTWHLGAVGTSVRSHLELVRQEGRVRCSLKVEVLESGIGWSSPKKLQKGPVERFQMEPKRFHGTEPKR